jgi:hypothetical protein
VLCTGQKVLVQTEVKETHKKKKMGKSYFPFSGTIVKVVREGLQYQVKQDLVPGAGEKTNTVSKLRFKRDQLLAITDELEEVTIQHFRDADSWNSYENTFSEKNVGEIFRERKTQNGFLELLCLYNTFDLPVWKPITSVAESDAYLEYEKNRVFFFWYFNHYYFD